MKIKDLPKACPVVNAKRSTTGVDRRFDKVEMYWGTSHDVINTRTYRCVATFWTKDEACKEAEYFSEYVGVDLSALDLRRGSIHAKKAKDGVLDVIVNAKKFNQRIFNRVVGEVLEK